jgi:predicted transposase YdaD
MRACDEHENQMADPTPIDRALKALFRDVPQAFLRLAGADAALARPPGDVSINLPEFRADGVLPVDEPGEPDAGALYFEWQWEPDTRELPDWFLKCAGLTAQLRRPVVLIVIYLHRGDRATFPDAYRPIVAGDGNSYGFATIRLWEHADRIRRGDLPELAPLLVLCEAEPDAAILEEERELILSLEVPEPVRADLLAIAVAVGGRFVPKDLVRAIFREEIEVIKETGLIGEWLDEAEARGETRGGARAAQNALLRLLESRFGTVPESVVTRVRAADEEWCYALVERAALAATLADLGLEA